MSPKTITVLLHISLVFLLALPYCSSDRRQATLFVHRIGSLLTHDDFSAADSVYIAVMGGRKASEAISLVYGSMLNDAGHFARAVEVVSACSTEECKSVFLIAFESLQKQIEDTPLDSIILKDHLNYLEHFYALRNSPYPKARALFTMIKLVRERPREWSRAGKYINQLDEKCNEFDSSILRSADCAEYKVYYLKGCLAAEQNDEWGISGSDGNSFETVNCGSVAYCQGLVNGAVAILKKKVYNATALDSTTAALLERWPMRLDDVKAAMGHGLTINGQDHRGRTLLILSACQTAEPITRYLLKKGADISIRDDIGATAITHAVWGNNPDAFNALIEAGADIHQTTKDGGSLLMIAAHCGCEKMVEILIGRGVNPNEKNKEGQTALMATVAENPHLDSDSSYARAVNRMLDLLLKNGAAIDEKDTCGNTALMYAAIFNQQPAIHFLIAKGADRNIKNHKNETAMDIMNQNKR